MAQPSAAQQVFNLVELLEKILGHVAEDVETTQEPATQLFPLQRVNSTFQTVIADSKQLRQHMWLAKASHRTPSGVPNVVGISWLLIRLLEHLSIAPIWYSKNSMCISVDTSLEAAPKDEATKRILAPEATWRGMLAIPAVVSERFKGKVDLKAMRKRGSTSAVGHENVSKISPASSRWASFMVKPDATLEDVAHQLELRGLMSA